MIVFGKYSQTMTSKYMNIPTTLDATTQENYCLHYENNAYPCTSIVKTLLLSLPKAYVGHCMLNTCTATSGMLHWSPSQISCLFLFSLTFPEILFFSKTSPRYFWVIYVLLSLIHVVVSICHSEAKFAWISSTYSGNALATTKSNSHLSVVCMHRPWFDT